MSKKLLVVEDSIAISKIIQQIAESLNYDVTVAKSMSEVDRILEQNNDFFAATLDYSLPDAEDGEVIETVLSHNIPSVVMTGHMDEKTRNKILSFPVIDYIPKENSQAFMYLKRILFWQKTNKGTAVLVVDDSRAARNHVVELLKRRNFTVFVTDSGKKALEILSRNPSIKLVVTDLEMPEMDGIELTNEIRKHYNRDKLAVIGISGASNTMLSARFIKNGADDFLRKPFCPEEFYCRLMQNIENLYNIEQIQKAANTDYLTELPNRRSFFANSQAYLNKYIANDVQYALAMLDIDHFKKINDEYGHDAGDHILKVLSSFMRKHLTSALLARLGGEEFAVLIPGIEQEQILNRLDDFRRELSVAPIHFEQHQIHCTVSMGVVFNSRSALSEQLSEADVALYQAKENGRNQICIADTASN